MLLTPWLSLLRAGLMPADRYEVCPHAHGAAVLRGFRGQPYAPAHLSRYTGAHWRRSQMRHHLRHRQRLS